MDADLASPATGAVKDGAQLYRASPCCWRPDGVRGPRRRWRPGRNCSCSTSRMFIKQSPETAVVAAAVVRERHRVLLLLAAFAFQVWLSTLRVALVEPPMHADHAQNFPIVRRTLLRPLALSKFFDLPLLTSDARTQNGRSELPGRTRESPRRFLSA